MRIRKTLPTFPHVRVGRWQHLNMLLGQFSYVSQVEILNPPETTKNDHDEQSNLFLIIRCNWNELILRNKKWQNGETGVQRHRCFQRRLYSVFTHPALELVTSMLARWDHDGPGLYSVCLVKTFKYRKWSGSEASTTWLSFTLSSTWNISCIKVAFIC